MDRGARLLEVRQLHAAYGSSQILFGVSFDIGLGEVVTLLGRNGMGKTTTVRTLLGLVTVLSGTVLFKREAIRGQPPHRIARAGIGLVPEGRQVFPNLTVCENLIATAADRNASRHPWTLDRVLALLPALADRRNAMAGRLSGGEQQMVAIGRALMTNPDLLILDEATEGLAPLVRQEIWRAVGHLKDEGTAILLIDKNLDALTRIADRHYIVEKGRTVWSGSSHDLVAASDVRRRYLGI